MAVFKLLYKPGKGPARNDMRGSSEGAGKSFVVGGATADWLDPGGSREVRGSEDASL